MMAAAPILSTYRIQLTPEFGFDDTAAIAGYLADLGVSHLYASPYLQAAPGSTHGYDVVDHSALNTELGGEEGHTRLHKALGAAGLGQVLDIVPNHMAVGSPGNRWWWDVLVDGPASRYAGHFDVDWSPPEAKLANRVLLPVLGDQYGKVLESGELGLRRDGAEIVVTYFDNEFPVSPRTLDVILSHAASRAEDSMLGYLADAFGALPLATEEDYAEVARRWRNREVLERLLSRHLSEEPEAASATDEVLAEVTADPHRLHALLERQNYRLAFWKTARDELDYRRFFDITTLAGLRVERDAVFWDSHRLVLDLLRRGVVDGLRVDHPDGLRDPAGYFERLAAAAPGAWIVVEKILEPGEKLPSWPVAGTTGYDFLHRVGGLFVDPRGETALTSIYDDFVGRRDSYREVVLTAKQAVLRNVLAADVGRLAGLFCAVCEENLRYRDFTRRDLYDALEATLVHFPVYRTYVRPGAADIAPDDDTHLTEAIEGARAARPELDPAIFSFLGDILRLRVEGAAALELAMRFQQLSGPAMAKGVEDTSFYRYNRLISLNEVGGDPGTFGTTLASFHATNTEVGERWPTTMLTTSTHDTKRSEDVRARISLLSELPEVWGEGVNRWRAHNRQHRRGTGPDPSLEYLLYQSLVGAHPLPADRAWPYLQKAAREAKQSTSWTDPDEEFESSTEQFVHDVLSDPDFLGDLDAFVAPLVWPGRVTSLAQTLLTLTSPGIPDRYQGAELWTDSLVDPDNRRPVDFEHRRRLLAECQALTPEQLLERADEGLPKLWVVHRSLLARRDQPETFLSGAYEALPAEGSAADHVVAFARAGTAISVAPRLVWSLGGRWGDTTVALPPGTWRDQFTGAVHAHGRRTLEQLLGRFPVALLIREDTA